MLEMRPNCECCNADLLPSAAAMICSFERTFCPRCSENKLSDTCPNCSGGLTIRPTRTEKMLAKFPASTQRLYKPEGCDSGYE